ncbi:MAG: hypothetical protein QM728_04620 [Gordonia sp. (in: high G+C Gram-positive bacteria)]|uniref:hypothetical protein n=1 Tax=Gordonia sp. (in: high G+C Gram-positive bacteria) TaxID=84139 RepID=UPI0039E7190A
MTVTLHAPAAHHFAAGHQDIAQRAIGSALSLRGDVALLMPAFGLIGVEFLGVLATVIDGAARHLDHLGVHHGAISGATRAGVDAYESTDAAAAARTGAA